MFDKSDLISHKENKWILPIGLTQSGFSFFPPPLNWILMLF